MSADADAGPDVRAEERPDERTEARAEECRRAARALAPCTRHDGGLTLSGSSAAALAELLRVLARDGADVTDAVVRAARRLHAEAQAQSGTPTAATAGAPAPRAAADAAPGSLAAR
ncbi:hypothetical protein [Actinomycetospora cinnamomea]|uniref:Uncharacterized protein n=1 Tax=Actinomycetospora cinnamomea TaxID=663609 RepID=A0A2U1EC29_9PSEU|nr:hypothetical protein [Actinomycetospora cinnamomea]PVY97470.1 hypothetical protein C8D89_1247 [Actinomycetospora cinnamomea]